MKPSDYFRNAVKDYLAKKERGAQKDLAAAAGITPRHLNDFLGGRRSMTEEDQIQIVKAIGVEYISFLRKGKALIEGVDIVQTEPKRPIIIQTVSEAQKNYIDGDQFRAVPLYESGRLAAWSNGAAFDVYERATDHVMVYLPEIKHRLSHTLVAARVGGDSMDPLIPEGSIVIIDLSDKEFYDRRVYACNWDEGGIDMVVVKRVMAVPEAKSFLLLSENRDYGAVMTNVDWDRLCIGRVVWMWRDLLEG
jgi:phage repressor protein C with HTH and peptisase S24 domain